MSPPAAGSSGADPAPVSPPAADTGHPGPEYLRQPLGDFLDRVAAEEPAPGGGAVAAVAVALAAGLAGMAARFSRHHTVDAPGMAADADALRRRAAPLAQADAAAYEQVLASYTGPRDGEDPAARRRRLHAALSHAADVPLAVAEIGSSVAGLAARLAERGNPNLRGDAIAAALLAEAGTRAAATLVAINTAQSGPGDERAARADDFAAAAAAATSRGGAGGG